jgi:uncharacterized protein YjeT (DUF2065 family)
MRMCCRKAKKMARVTESAISEVVQTPSRAVRAVGWTSLAVGVTALGLYVGRELRIRYKLNRRTPSDLFSHAGEDFSAEYGVGI